MSDRFLEAVAEAAEGTTGRTPSRLKSRIYSALVRRQSTSGPLLSLTETKHLCVFEKLVQVAPVGEDLKSRNPCRLCHARILAETVENAPLFWRHCPYAGFQSR